MPVLPAALFLLLAGCHGDKTPSPEDTGQVELCADGTRLRPFQPDGDGEDHGELAGDLTLDTTAGPWTLSDAWNGCDSVLFLGVPSSSSSYLSTLLDADPLDLLEEGPQDARYVFFADGDEAHHAALETLLDDALSRLDEEALAWWSDRVRLGTGMSSEAGGWVGEILDRYRYPVVAVDREQRIREVGYLADPLDGWETTDWSYLGEEANLHAFEAAREDALASHGDTVVRVWDQAEVGGEGWNEGAMTVDLTAAAAGATRVDVDITLSCGGAWYVSCPEWDTVNWLKVCDADGGDCSELARLVTGYWRGGRWVTDGTHLLDRLQGETTLVYSGGEARYLTLDLRFWDDGSGRVPLSSTQVWWDIYSFWDDAWTASHQGYTFTPPTDATRVELVHAITGHGADTEGCSEFCPSRHEFVVNGTEPLVTDFADAGTANGCRDRVRTGGVVPNQAGTWTYGRAGWCPGQGVDPVRWDITSRVRLGEENVLDYTAWFEDQSARGTDANFDPSVLLVYSR